MTKNQKIIAALSIVSVLVIGAGVLTYTLRDNNSDSSMDKNETEQVIQETSNSSILSGVEELVSQEDQTTDIKTGDEVELKETISNETEDNETVDQEQDSVEKVEYETYTNEFFPELSFEYDDVVTVDDFEFESEIYSNLRGYGINVFNGNEVLSLKLLPVIAYGCEVEIEGTKLVESLNNGINIFKNSDGRFSATNSNISYCFNNTINSTIPASKSEEFQKLNGTTEGSVDYLIFIEFENNDPSDRVFRKILSTLQIV